LAYVAEIVAVNFEYSAAGRGTLFVGLMQLNAGGTMRA